jgi:hypothetical protein
MFTGDVFTQVFAWIGLVTVVLIVCIIAIIYGVMLGLAYLRWEREQQHTLRRKS